jgi:drug/metabolite transporter (DMT)-like permease
MLVASLFFALMGMLTHAVGSRCHWLVAAWIRAGFMLVVMVVFARATGARLHLWRPRTLWLRSLCGSFSLVCNFYALTMLPVADALTLSHTYPLWIVMLTTLVYRQRPTFWEVAGVLLAGAGVVLIERPGFSMPLWPTIVALTSAFATSVAMLGLHRLRSVDPRAIVAHFAGVAFLVASVALLPNRQWLTSALLSTQTLALLLGVAVTGSIGQFCLTNAYARGRPASLAVIGLSQVVFALVFDVVFFHRTLTPLTMLGFAMVLAPSALLSGMAGRRLVVAERDSMVLTDNEVANAES